MLVGMTLRTVLKVPLEKAAPLALLTFRHPWSQISKCRVANGPESNGLDRIFAKKENCGKGFRAPLYYLKQFSFLQ